MRLNKFLIACGFIGPAIFFFTAYFLFPSMYSGYDSAQRYLSELGATGSPVRVLTNVFGFSLFGILIMLFAYGLARSPQINIVGKMASFFFFLTGILMFLVGIFVCDPNCHNYSILGNWHNHVSDYQFPVLAVGLVIFALSVIGNKNLRILTPLILTLGAATLYLAKILFFSPPPPPPNVGILQRSAIGLPYALMAVMAIVLYKNEGKEGKT